MQDFFFLVCLPQSAMVPWSQAFPAETVETGDENPDHLHCMQMSLVMSMRFIFGPEGGRGGGVGALPYITYTGMCRPTGS